MTSTSLVSAPLALQHAYSLWLWLDARAATFPTADRHGLGQQLRDTAFATLDVLTVATYAPRRSLERSAALTTANHRLALLRLVLRGARERRLLSIDQHTHGAELTATLGRMLGAWLRAESSNPQDRAR